MYFFIYFNVIILEILYNLLSYIINEIRDRISEEIQFLQAR